MCVCVCMRACMHACVCKHACVQTCSLLFFVVVDFAQNTGHYGSFPW